MPLIQGIAAECGYCVETDLGSVICPKCPEHGTEIDEMVHHPKHYNDHPSGIECINIVQHYNFNVGSAIKYLWRQGLKDIAPVIQDLEKAKVYIDFEIKRIKKYGAQ